MGLSSLGVRTRKPSAKMVVGRYIGPGWILRIIRWLTWDSHTPQHWTVYQTEKEGVVLDWSWMGKVRMSVRVVDFR